MAKPNIVGRWLIESMTEWARDFIDEEVHGYFEFDKKDSGDFQFGYVAGQLDYRLVEQDGKPAVEFSWDGHDEMDSAQGRGWLVLEGDELKGMFYFHLGDESGIVLKREKCFEPVENGNSRSFGLESYPKRGGFHEYATTTLHDGAEGSHSQEVLD